MSSKYRFLIFLFFALLILIPVSFYLKSLISNVSKQNFPAASALLTSPQLKESEFIDPNSLNIHSSFMGFSLTKESSENVVLGKPAFYYSNKAKNLFEEGVDLKGDEWLAEKDGVSDTEFSSYVVSIAKLFNDKFKNLGWDSEQAVNGYKFQSISAGGGGGSINGYLKINNGKIQVVLLAYRKNTPTCPCELQFRIFVSNVSELNTLLK